MNVVLTGRALEDESTSGRYIIGDGPNPRARAELGWQPSHPRLADEFRHGSYRA